MRLLAVHAHPDDETLSNGALLIVYGVVILVTVSLASDAFSDVASAVRSALGRRAPEPSQGETT